MHNFLFLLKLVIVGLALAQVYEIMIATNEREQAKRNKFDSLKDNFEILDRLEKRAIESVQYDDDAFDLKAEDDAETSGMIYMLKVSMAYLAEVPDHQLNELGLKNNADHLRDSIY